MNLKTFFFSFVNSRQLSCNKNEQKYHKKTFLMVYNTYLYVTLIFEILLKNRKILTLVIHGKRALLY